MTNEKLNFLLNTFPDLLMELDAATKPKWGKMNVQQMIEHMTDSVREANGKIPRTIITMPERLPAMKAFVMSEKEFRPETKNALMGDEPSPVRNADKENAIAELKDELKDFVDHYTNNPESVITNAFFGHLNYQEWIQLLHKHAVHHLKQFGLKKV
jgi:hypothetical protein